MNRFQNHTVLIARPARGIGRFAEPEEIAGIVAFLVSSEGRYLMGQAIEVDDGMLFN